MSGVGKDEMKFHLGRAISAEESQILGNEIPKWGVRDCGVIGSDIAPSYL